MRHFATATSVGLRETLVAMGLVDLAAMLCEAFDYRLPPPDWGPAGRTAPAGCSAMIPLRNAQVKEALAVRKG